MRFPVSDYRIELASSQPRERVAIAANVERALAALKAVLAAAGDAPTPKPADAGPVPQSAIDFLKSKGVKAGFSYKDVWQQEHSLAFTVAKMMEVDLLAHVRDSIAQAVQDGTPFDEWAKNIKPTFEQSGWIAHVGTDEVPSRLQKIYDTNTRMARANGQADRIQRTKDVLPYLKYELGPSEEHRTEHAAWAGTILPVDDAWWGTHTPPLGYGCKCRIRQLTPSEAGRDGVLAQAPTDADNLDGIDPSFAYDKTYEGRKRALASSLTDSEDQS